MSGMNAIYKSDEGQRLVESRYRDLLTRWPVPSEQRSISTSFGDTFVVACGPPSMSPVVLLQGSGANAAMWLSDVATLAASHRVYCVDVIGEPGLSAPSRPRLDATTYASWLREVLDGLGVAHVSVIGVSLGGWLALAFATAEPQRVDRLVLVSTGGVGRIVGKAFRRAAVEQELHHFQLTEHRSPGERCRTEVLVADSEAPRSRRSFAIS